MIGIARFENAYALAMTRKKAETLNIHSISDLASTASELTIAGDYEIFFPAGVDEHCVKPTVFGSAAERQMQPEFMAKAAADGTG